MLIEIVDLMGRVCWSGKTLTRSGSTDELNMDLVPGTYTIKSTTSLGSRWARMVIN